MTGVQYRIVQKIRTVTGVTAFSGTVDETDREDISAVVRTGTLCKTPEQIARQTATSLEFCEDEASLHEGGNDDYMYYLQTLQDGRWCDVKSLRPVPYLDDEDGEDPLTGDTDDGSNYVPDADPTTTQHYFALRSRGEI